MNSDENSPRVSPPPLQGPSSLTEPTNLQDDIDDFVILRVGDIVDWEELAASMPVQDALTQCREYMMQNGELKSGLFPHKIQDV